MPPRPYPSSLEITPRPGPVHAAPRLPGSKSITNRAFVLAALAGRGRGCTLDDVLLSDDTEVMIESLRRLGFRVDLDGGGPSAHLSSPGSGPLIPAASADLFVGNSGTTMRFLTALLALGHGRYRLDGVPRMRERPIADLLDGLSQLGVRAASETGNGCPPVAVDADGLNGGAVRIRGDVSSQFLSGLLMAAPLARGDVAV